MGWCSGSYLANDIWDMIKDYLPNEVQIKVATLIVDKFSDMDADCWENPDGIEGVAHPEWFEEWRI